MKALFTKETSDGQLRAAVDAIPFAELLGQRVLLRAEPDAGGGGVRLIFRKDVAGSNDPDGGLCVNVVSQTEVLGPVVATARIKGGDQMDAVIREKQVLRKIQRSLESVDGYVSSRIRAFGSGSF